MDTNERIDLLEQASEQLMDAISNIRTAVKGTSEDARANAYIIPHLEGWLDGNEMTTITGLIEALESDDESEDEEEYDDDDYEDDGNEFGQLDW